MSYNYITYHQENRLGYITLNRPDKRNALNSDMVVELKQAFTEAGRDPDVKVIILKAAGDVFSAGADLKYLQTLQQNSFDENLADSRNLMELFHEIYTLEKIVIAQVEGHAIAGGCGLATVCDLSFAVPEALFGYTEVKIGFIPAIVMVFLRRKLGEAAAKSLLFSGELIKAEKARSLGMINEVVEADKIAEKVATYAGNICDNASGESLRLTKEMLAHIPEKTLEEALQYAAEMNAKARETDDCHRGISSFLDKIKIKW